MGSESKFNSASVLYFPHGGGPLPLLGHQGHAAMISFLQTVTPMLGKPEAILVISAHWEEMQPTITSGANPALIYDYYGFPEESYTIRYPAPGDPALARRLHRLLTDEGVEAVLDDRRGFDHGLFVPLKIMYPEANIPCVQLSLLAGLDPERHIQIGQAMAALRKEKILILGSGFSFHNMGAFIFDGPSTADPRNDAFQKWLVNTCNGAGLTQEDRTGRLKDWQQAAPYARYCHPREEHLLPLHVCYGIAGSAASKVFELEVLGKNATAFLWH